MINFCWQKLAFGYKKGSGIMCSCCNKEVLLLCMENDIVGGIINRYMIVLHNVQVSPSQFEAHAGCSSRRKP